MKTTTKKINTLIQEARNKAADKLDSEALRICLDCIENHTTPVHPYHRAYMRWLQLCHSETFAPDREESRERLQEGLKELNKERIKHGIQPHAELVRQPELTLEEWQELTRKQQTA